MSELTSVEKVHALTDRFAVSTYGLLSQHYRPLYMRRTRRRLAAMLAMHRRRDVMRIRWVTTGDGAGEIGRHMFRHPTHGHHVYFGRRSDLFLESWRKV